MLQDFQERVIEEVKSAIRPYFNSRQISKDEYKEILKKSVPKVKSHVDFTFYWQGLQHNTCTQCVSASVLTHISVARI